MRKATAALAVVATALTMALPAAAKPTHTDTLALGWDSNSVTYADGVVTLNVVTSTMVECGGATAFSSEVWSGTAPATLDVKNSLRSGTLSFDAGSPALTVMVDNPCASASTSVSGPVVLEFSVDGTTTRTRNGTERHLQKSGMATLSMLSDVPVNAVVEKVISR